MKVEQGCSNGIDAVKGVFGRLSFRQKALSFLAIGVILSLTVTVYLWMSLSRQQASGGPSIFGKPVYQHIFAPTALFFLWGGLAAVWILKRPNVKGITPITSKVFAPMPGRCRFFVKANENVEKGAALFEIEAMKMFSVVRSPIQGKVVKLADIGNSVLGGQIIVELEST